LKLNAMHAAMVRSVHAISEDTKIGAFKVVKSLDILLYLSDDSA